DPPATNDDIVPIKDGTLSWSDGALRLVELDHDFAINKRDCCRFRLESVPNLHLTSNRRIKSFDGDPVIVAYRKLPAKRIFADHDPIQFRLDAHDVLRFSRRYQSFPLADRVPVNPIMFAQNISLFGNYFTRPIVWCTGILLDELGIRSAFYEAD